LNPIVAQSVGFDRIAADAVAERRLSGGGRRTTREVIEAVPRKRNAEDDDVLRRDSPGDF